MSIYKHIIEKKKNYNLLLSSVNYRTKMYNTFKYNFELRLSEGNKFYEQKITIHLDCWKPFEKWYFYVIFHTFSVVVCL